MSRIRSIHPGFFTDERLVSTSFQARLLCLGLGIEADDKGIFEWKPVTLKMRLFPADNVEIGALLGELEQAGVLKSFEIDGRKYGAIRNFRKHQRPKTPNNIHPITPEISNYVGLTASVSESGGDEPQPFPTKGEKSPQMEEGGGREGEGGQKPTGFSARGAREKPARSAWVSPRTHNQAAASLIEEIDNGFGRTEGRNEITGEAVRLLPAVRAS